MEPRREPTKPTLVRCEVCGNAMRLTRTTPVVSQRECYEFWQCVACGHIHLRAVQLQQSKARPTV
jgi:uncharacterized protein with PIN domain